MACYELTMDINDFVFDNVVQTRTVVLEHVRANDFEVKVKKVIKKESY